MLRKYTLHSVDNEGWAVVVIDTKDGYFSTVSDYGNYSFQWNAIGEGNEFRKFLIGLQPDYLHGKLMQGRPDAKIWDEDGTEANIRDGIETRNKEELENTGKKWKHYEKEKETLRSRTPMDYEAFEAWQTETRLGDPWEYGRLCPEPQCMAFCTKTMPRLKALLEEELAHEAQDQKDVEVLREAKPAIVAAAKADLDAHLEALRVAPSLHPDERRFLMQHGADQPTLKEITVLVTCICRRRMRDDGKFDVVRDENCAARLHDGRET